MKFYMISLMACLLVLGGCRKYTYTCHNDYLRLQFVQYDSTMVDTLIIKTYLKNTSIPALDSQLFTTTGYPYNHSVMGDTIDVQVYIPADSFDHELIIPASGESFLFRDIVSQPPQTRTGKTSLFEKVDNECVNKILSYQLNGVPQAVIYNQFGTLSPVFLHR